MTTLAIPLAKIRADDRCQPRVMFDSELVGQYAEAMAGGDQFPPVVTFYDGVDYFLADGFHRYHAAKGCNRAEIDCDVRDGTLRDAILYSCSANAAHGWRRTNDDKRRAVTRLLNDAEWSKWSDREIARKCAVGADMVGRLRPADTVVERQYTHPKTGTVTTMRTANIGSQPRPHPDLPIPSQSPPPRSWREEAAPERIDQINAVNRETSLTGALREIRDRYRQLPDPNDAANRFPDLLLHSLTWQEMLEIGAWFTSFADAIRIRKEYPDAA